MPRAVGNRNLHRNLRMNCQRLRRDVGCLVDQRLHHWGCWLWWHSLRFRGRVRACAHSQLGCSEAARLLSGARAGWPALRGVTSEAAWGLPGIAPPAMQGFKATFASALDALAQRQSVRHVRFASRRCWLVVFYGAVPNFFCGRCCQATSERLGARCQTRNLTEEVRVLGSLYNCLRVEVYISGHSPWLRQLPQGAIAEGIAPEEQALKDSYC